MPASTVLFQTQSSCGYLTVFTLLYDFHLIICERNKRFRNKHISTNTSFKYKQAGKSKFSTFANCLSSKSSAKAINSKENVRKSIPTKTEDDSLAFRHSD